ncbi:hypothetical protein SLS56_002737 [Neofusicoccum ribis]|uniref:Uncharacterized protein n=1 Tax=Neofusicoccum ribis TaxID=45134 RepID=A0ABR3T3Z0_9PEZI
MRQPNFEQCGKDYMANATAQALYGWRGPVIGIAPNNQSQITTEGCKILCGTYSDYYPWSLASSTITTWILPVVGILLQAPFESNAFSHTILAIARWVGSPMASLAYILWNIKVSAKCALMGFLAAYHAAAPFYPAPQGMQVAEADMDGEVDMATRCDEPIPDEQSHFSSIRDSFYILMTMNQYTMRRSEALNKEAEGLLRIVLFSKDLQLRGKDGKEKRLNKVRQDLAHKLRAARKRGTVPVFVSTGWFLFSLAISIQASFGELGHNSTAHDLALGLLLAWLPVLILCSIVDRNPVAADDIRKKLNKLIDIVCKSLQDEEIREDFIGTFEGQPECKRMEAWVRRISEQSKYMQDFFVDFAGQGRVRWHYGAAHPILSDIEDCYVTRHGRGWLANETEARMHLVLGGVDEGLLWFDFRELWQIGSGMLIVGGTCFGAFILSYYTPTIGLGCRSGGYVIFCITSSALLTLELLVWWMASPVRPEQPHWVRRSITRIQTQHTVIRMEERAQDILQRAKAKLKRFANAAQHLFIKATLPILSILPISTRLKIAIKSSLKHQAESCQSWTFQQWAENCFFRPLEVINFIWLLYIVLAQTFGSYRTCECQTSTWGRGGGYMDFQQSDQTNSPWVRWYWSAGTAVGTAIMSFSMMYVVSEWCQQSHLSTENYAAAARGLHRTRAYRRLTYPLRLAWRTLEAATFLLLKAVLVTVFRRLDGPRADNSVRWTPDGASPRVPSFGSSTTTGGGSDGGAAMLGVTPSIQLEEWTDAHIHHSRPRHRTHDRYRSISLDTDPLSTADSLHFSPPYFPGSRSRSRSRGESDASSRALLGLSKGSYLIKLSLEYKWTT